MIRGLPPGLRAGTQVNVVFEYESNGRLKVRASVPSTGQKAKLEIDRDPAVTDSKLDEWGKKIRNRNRPAEITIDATDVPIFNGSSTKPSAAKDAATAGPIAAGTDIMKDLLSVDDDTDFDSDDGFTDLFDIDDFLK